MFALGKQKLYEGIVKAVRNLSAEKVNYEGEESSEIPWDSHMEKVARMEG